MCSLLPDAELTNIAPVKVDFVKSALQIPDCKSFARVECAVAADENRISSIPPACVDTA
jgi:hypothetical protein